LFKGTPRAVPNSRLWLRVHLKSWQEYPEKSGEKKPKDTWHGALEP
jgi:hypothetical protein